MKIARTFSLGPHIIQIGYPDCIGYDWNVPGFKMFEVVPLPTGNGGGDDEDEGEDEGGDEGGDEELREFISILIERLNAEFDGLGEALRKKNGIVMRVWTKTDGESIAEKDIERFVRTLRAESREACFLCRFNCDHMEVKVAPPEDWITDEEEHRSNCIFWSSKAF